MTRYLDNTANPEAPSDVGISDVTASYSQKLSEASVIWPKARLGEVARYINGRAFKPSEWVDKGLPIIRIQNLNDPSAPFNYCDGHVDEKHKVRDGDLLVSWSASLDVFIWDRSDAALNQHIFKVEECTELVTRQYLYYALREVMAEIREQTHGATMKHINKPEFEAFEIPLPPLEEQKRIAARLTDQLAAVDRARRASEARLEAARALPAAWLREIFENTAMESWETKPLLDICLSKGQYGTSQKSNNTGKGPPVLGMKHIRGGKIVAEDLATVDLPSNEIEKYLLQPGDLLFNRTNSAELVGKTAVFDLSEDMVFASYLIRFRLNREVADPRFVSAYINSRLGRNFIESNMTRAIGQVNISASTMHELAIPLPPVSFQKSAMEELEGKSLRTNKLEKELSSEQREIGAMPGSLLRSAFAGA